MTFQYNLNYIGGISGYNKRAIYTLKIKDDCFFVNGLIKSKKFSYDQINKIIFGTTDELKGRIIEVNDLLFNHVKLLDYRLNRKLRYCLVIVLKDTTIIFAEEDDANIKNAIQFLLSGNTAGIFCVIYASLLALPVPFEPVHLLFINLLTDSLPAIAIGMEPARNGLLDQKPRDPKEPILNRPLLTRIGGQGLLIAIATMAAFYIGYADGDARMASTMAFATLTLARLFHGFNCRGSESIFSLKFSTNKYSVMAFFAGVVLLLAVLFVPGLKSLFMVSPAFSAANLGEIALLAFLPTVLIQIYKVISEHKNR